MGRLLPVATKTFGAYFRDRSRHWTRNRAIFLIALFASADAVEISVNTPGPTDKHSDGEQYFLPFRNQLGQSHT